jgi:tetratricopeptide (TPR) repeat protein
VVEFQEQQRERLSEDQRDADAAFELARALHYQQEHTDAEHWARTAVQETPLNPEYLELLGSVLYAQGRYAESIKEWNAALQVDADRISLYLKLALAYEQIREYERALVALEDVLQRDDRYSEAYFQLARVHLKQQDYPNALQAVERLLLLEPSNREGQLLKLRVYIAQSNFYPASILAQQLLEQDPKWVEVLREQLRIFYLQQQEDEALGRIKELARMGRLEPEDQMIYALLLSGRGQNNAARQVLEELLRREPANVEALLGLAQLSLQGGDYAQALRYVEQGLELDNRRADLFFLQASLLFQRRDFLQGDLALRQALELDDRPLPYRLLQARRQLMRGEFQRVEAAVADLQSEDPTNVDLLTLRADVLVSQRRYGQAENLLRQALVVQETFALRFSLARVLYLQRQYAKAAVFSSELTQDFPFHWESTYLHAMTLLQLDRPEEALVLAEAFLARQESQGLAHRLVADIYRYRGQEQPAQEVLVRGLERHPRQEYLTEALSSSYLVTRQFEKARVLLENALRNESAFQTLFLDRLVTVYRQLNDQTAYQRTLRQFQLQNDPIAIQQSLTLPPLIPLLSPVPEEAPLAMSNRL